MKINQYIYKFMWANKEIYLGIQKVRITSR